MENYKILIDTNNTEETIYFAIPADKIERLKVSDTYGNHGQPVSPEDAGDSVSLLTQKAVDVANWFLLSSPKYYVFINDNEPSMNVMASDEESIRTFLTNTFDANWEDLKKIADVTQLYKGNGDMHDFLGANFTNLVKDVFKINDNISAYEHSDSFEAVIKECEEDADYSYHAESCDGFNFWDGNNWASIIIWYEYSSDHYTGWELLDDEKLEKELNEAIDKSSYVREEGGYIHYEADGYNVVESFWQGTWDKYRITKQKKRNKAEGRHLKRYCIQYEEK